MTEADKKTIDFLSIPIHRITMSETLHRIDECIRRNGHINYMDINASKIVSMQTDPELYRCIISCDLINADGQSIVWASRLLGEKLPERISGIDLMINLMELAHKKSYRCFFLGAEEHVVRKLVDLYTRKYGPEIVAGFRNGYFRQEEEDGIVKKIVESRANILFVGITSPKKDIFLNRYQDLLRPVNFTMGVGGSFDVIAGIKRRAPRWMQRAGLEWFFRFLQEPRRMWKRYLIGNLQFIIIILKQRFRQKKK